MCQFPLFETIAIIEGIPQNLAFHQERVNKAMFELFNKSNGFILEEIINIPEVYKQGVIRCRIDYDANHFKFTFTPYQRKLIKNYQCIYVDNIHYAYKFSNRVLFDNLKSDCDEVIIINNGFVSDCRIGNLLFYKKGIWYSPKHYLLKGTQLSLLLEQKKVVLTEIKTNDLAQYEKIMMINAMNPFDENRCLPIQCIRR